MLKFLAVVAGLTCVLAYPGPLDVNDASVQNIAKVSAENIGKKISETNRVRLHSIQSAESDEEDLSNDLKSAEDDERKEESDENDIGIILLGENPDSENKHINPGEASDLLYNIVPNDLKASESTEEPDHFNEQHDDTSENSAEAGDGQQHETTVNIPVGLGTEAMDVGWNQKQDESDSGSRQENDDTSENSAETGNGHQDDTTMGRDIDFETKIMDLGLWRGRNADGNDSGSRKTTIGDDIHTEYGKLTGDSEEVKESRSVSKEDKSEDIDVEDFFGKITDSQETSGEFHLVLPPAKNRLNGDGVSDSFGNIVSSVLKQMSPRQRILSGLLINEVLHQGLNDELSESTKIRNAPSSPFESRRSPFQRKVQITRHFLSPMDPFDSIFPDLFRFMEKLPSTLFHLLGKRSTP